MGNEEWKYQPPERRPTVQLKQETMQRQMQAQKIAPHLIQANTLLQCSNAELIQLIEQEQRENPALDDVDDEPEPDGVAAEFGLRERDERADTREHSSDERTDLSQIEYDRKDSAALPGDSDFDPLMLARAQTTLSEQLLMHLRATSETPMDARVAEYLVDSLDARGWVQIDMDEACFHLSVSCTRLLAGIARLQGCDPPGVGARDLRECLLLQIFHMQGGDEPCDPIVPTVQRLLTDHWEALIQRRHAHLARRLNVSPGQIEAARDFIQNRLTPHPAAQYRQPWEHRPDTSSATVRPDVVIKRGVNGFEVEVQGFENMTLHINPHYRSLYETIRVSRAGGSPAKVGKRLLSEDHEKHVIAYVERATLFLKNLQQRKRTIQKIALALVESQQGFLETGQRRFLRPMTRTRLAETVGMHESTISRALLHKYVQLPTQDVVPFDIFFEQSVGVKETVAGLISEEDPDAPLSDKAIAEALRVRGAVVARRTVVKYREELRIPASYLRRRR